MVEVAIHAVVRDKMVMALEEKSRGLKGGTVHQIAASVHGRRVL